MSSGRRGSRVQSKLLLESGGRALGSGALSLRQSWAGVFTRPQTLSEAPLRSGHILGCRSVQFSGRAQSPPASRGCLPLSCGLAGGLSHPPLPPPLPYKSKEKDFLSTTARSLHHERWPVLATERFMYLVASEKNL